VKEEMMREEEDSFLVTRDYDDTTINEQTK
jgi:hypothetical protein